MTTYLMMCQGCGSRDKDVARREVRAKEYKGPCSDSFCYSSCTSASCRPLACILCPKCASKLENEGFSSLGPHPTPVLEVDLKRKVSSKPSGIRAFFRKIEFHGHGANEVSLVFIANSDDYDENRAIGNLVCSNVLLNVEEG